MIDFHCHLDLYPNARDVVREAVARECYILAVTTTPLAWEGTRRLIGDAPRIRLAAGLHPELVRERHREVERLCALVPRTRYVGEVGLDGSPPHRASMPDQRRVLSRVLRACEDAGGRVLSLHSRGAANGVLDGLEEHPKAGIPVLHWFSGSHADLRRAIAMGAWFSVGPAMLRGERGQGLARLMPRDRVLPETDGPFTRSGECPMMPWESAGVEQTLADLWKSPAADVARSLAGNLRCLVGLANRMQVL